MRAVAVLLLVTACGHDHHRDSTEVSLSLGKLTRNVRSAFIADEKFPIGTAGPTPAAPCCGQPDNKCPVTDAWKKSSVWRDLEFEIDEPTYHQYSYESAGKTFKISATSDIDCDGKPGTWIVDGRISNGIPETTTTPPAKGTY